MHITQSWQDKAPAMSQIKIEEYVIGKLFFLYEKPEDSHISVENYK